jgi:hypothetical protein
MTSFRRPAALLAMLVVSGAASAGQADICYSDRASGATADVLTDATPLTCPSAGRHTLPQLAQSGWSVVTVQSVVADYAPDAAGQPRTSTTWMVVVQKEGK